MLQVMPVGPGDAAFLFQIYVSTRQEEVANWGWDAPTQLAFLQMQWSAQRQGYAAQYPDADHQLILSDGELAGRLMVSRDAHALVLVDIALLPSFRNQGIGRALIEELQAEARATAKPLRLQVLKGNPAQHLYLRLGFVVTGENELYDRMEWQAG